jgi:hypothetical protein|nr:MAG TPA: hypothetical protein [Caudoviricetes sp.]
MDKSTGQVIRQIAEIQLEAIRIAKDKHITGAQLDCLFDHSITKDVDMAIDRLIELYSQMVDYPESVSLLPCYQLSLCSAVLAENSETWSIANSEGVYGAFELLNRVLEKRCNKALILVTHKQ